MALDTLLRRGYARSELDGRHVGAVGLACSARGLPPWAASDRVQAAGRAAGSVPRPWSATGWSWRPPQIPVEDVTLTLSGFSGGSGEQMGLFQDCEGTGGAAADGDGEAAAGADEQQARAAPIAEGGARGIRRRRCGRCRSRSIRPSGMTSGRCTRRPRWRCRKAMGISRLRCRLDAAGGA